MKTTLRTAGAALLAIAALALHAAAQDTQTAPAARPEATKQDQPAAQRPAAGTQDAGQAQRPAQQPAQRPDAAQQPAQRPDAAQQPNGATSKDDMMKRLATEEARHRETVAKIDRLRELAQQKGETERLAALADMLKTENDRYAAMRTKARAAMGDDTFKAMERRLAQGRGRGPGAQQKPDAGQQARKPDQKPQRPAPAGQQRPATPKANSDAKPAAPADRPKANNDAKPAAPADRPKGSKDNNRQAQANTGTRQPAAASPRGSNPK